ncbi:TetR family transcriptional regulator [Streptomyces albus]|uniref:TetR family transcriptional regulator n=1 Tax=Streptomyces albus (strain ATCC 21838 / DSM 41398 / FERM P-419 / JCM 4703 / NBRC 107858) TaxID=1081613 RepID=A0A0B5F6W2_STRA4|nr:TetR family transcriptional regulator [Streptomyces albus]AOU81608.1 TetR family transcriptional regulator [Streptomyces albus]
MSRDRVILKAAAEAFYEKGFHGVGVDELGARAGLSGPSLYRHFSGKDEILATLLNEAMDELISATVPVHDDAERDLRRALEHHVAFAVRHRHLVNLYQREVRSLVDPWKRAFHRRRGQYTARWASLFARRFPALGSAQVAAMTQACLGMIFSLSYWPAQTLEDIDVQPLLLDLMAHGFAPFAAETDPGPQAGQ